MSKETNKKNLLSAGILYLFLCNIIAVGYLLIVRVPSAPVWATYPIVVGVAISAGIAWFKK